MAYEKKEFDADFYAPRRKIIIQHYQISRGCFSCGETLDAMKTCSACKFAVYCNRECQKAHWKNENYMGQAPHKELCKSIIHFLWHCNGKSNNDKNAPSDTIATFSRPIPMHLGNLGYKFEEEVVEDEMTIYGDMFMDELVEAQVRSIYLSVFCFDDGDDIVQLHGSASFFSSGVKEVYYILFPKVDSGRNVVSNINSGFISEEAKRVAVEHIADFAKRLRGKGLRLMGLACGSAMMWLDNDGEAQARIRAV